MYSWLNNSKYSKYYFSIIANAKNRASTKKEAKNILGYTERHHIFPVCLGGNNLKENLVFLSAREHFICHLILARLYPKHFGLTSAVFFMAASNKNKVSSRTYEKLKMRFSLMLSSVPRSEDHKSAISKSLIGKKLAEEHKNNISKSKLGKKQSQLTKNAQSKRMLESYMDGGKLSPMSGKKHAIESKNKITRGLIHFYSNNDHYDVTAEQKEKISNTLKRGFADGTIVHGMKDKKHSEHAKELNRQKALARPKVACPYCGKVGPKPNMIQHHFNKCKSAR